MYCKNCGQIVPKGIKECPTCGQKVKSKGVIVAVLIALAAVAFAAFVTVFFFLKKTELDDELAKAQKGKNSSTSESKKDDKDKDKDNDKDKDDDDDDDKLGTPAESTTVMVYMIGSNLESDYGAATDDLEEMLAAEYENVNIVIQTGGAKYWYMDGIANKKVQRFHIEDGELVELDNLGKMSMSTPDALTDFVSFAAEEYPAEEYVLVLWDHGGGIPVGFGYDEVFPDDYLVDVELGQALDDAGVHFGAVVFDACNMCTLEVAMAIMDNADYMVAAESYVNGIGIYYTDWLNQTSSAQEYLVQDYCETIVADYMDSLDEEGLVGSMSVIKLSKIDEVYDAYVDYIASVADAVDNGGYESYYAARGNCGYYEGTDSVDLCTLCTQFDTDYATPLFNSVVNAVVYTESDINYGHGITAYSPYDYFDYYDEGRASLVTLGYDDEILDFYDMFASRLFDYFAPDYIGVYTGDWYVSSGESSADYYVGAGKKNEELEVFDLGGYFGLTLEEDEWDMIYSIAVCTYIEIDDESVWYLGSCYHSEFDKDGNLMIVDPDEWVYLNDEFCYYDCVDYYYDEDSGDWAEYGYIYCTVNGVDSVMLVYFDQDYTDGMILGYYDYDCVNDEITSDQMYAFNDDDVIDLLYYVYYFDEDTGYIFDNDDPFTYGDTVISREDIILDNDSTYLYYILEDYYGNTYETEMVYLYI